MTIPWLLALACGTFLLSVFLGARVRAFAVRKSILDHPNERSSHSAPTPRGGGLAIVTASLIAILALALMRVLPVGLAAALIGGGGAVATAGWLDDRRGLSPGIRALVHFAAAAWAVACVGGYPLFRIGVLELRIGMAGSFIACVALVWVTNFFNFMDGIDGIAAIEAALVTGLAIPLLLAGGQIQTAAVAAAIAAAACGFLVFNWPPARMFMGDVGSGYLGFQIGTLAIASEVGTGMGSWEWVLLLGVFITDATLTLARRVARRERWWSGHRTHAYQRAVQSGWSHRTVALGAAALTICLGEFARESVHHPARALLVGGGAYASLLLAYALIERIRPMRG